ncbi:hypothetical protein [Acinetobacter sp. ANC 4648]|uniref:hypothetical protein n=1 Tax=Acinetobacter sp. ANC 4648 TaxID=1977875 RepID=UPI000A355865|nr:hypothetical protein [Acinetobacter sp. ANC 4648]OTG81121.1 hypothetical protein B9T27_11765 [Acinetobacter sp. ANC 4648]
MKKFIYVLFLVGIAWLIKLSYDFYQISAQVETLQATLHQSEQQNAHLNDRLVAIQRQALGQQDQSLATDSKQIKTEVASGLSPNFVIQQQLELVQFALQQQQYVYAVEKLNQLEQALEHYALADAVKKSLHQSIEQDKQNIQQFVLARNAQQTLLEDILHQLDQKIAEEIESTQLKPSSHVAEHFWQKWFQIDVVTQASAELVNRKIILKETQLRILLAQQALARGEALEYQSMLNLAIQQLNALPDAASQQLKQQLINLKQIQMLPVPKLNSTAILG